MVHDLQTRVQAAKDNVEEIGQIMTKWSEAPLYERKEGKKEGLLNLEVNSLSPLSACRHPVITDTSLLWTAKQISSF